jgi:hypothetical protein
MKTDYENKQKLARRTNRIVHATTQKQEFHQNPIAEPNCGRTTAMPIHRRCPKSKYPISTRDKRGPADHNLGSSKCREALSGKPGRKTQTIDTPSETQKVEAILSAGSWVKIEGSSAAGNRAIFDFARGLMHTHRDAEAVRCAAG